MSCDISQISIDFDEFDKYHQPAYNQVLFDKTLHEAIFSPPDYPHPLTRTYAKQELEEGYKLQKVLRTSGIKPMGSVSAEAGVSYEWGGKDSGISGYVNGSARDDNGNKATVEVQVNNDGSGSVDVSVSHYEETNN
jgi:hypothetical protein